MRVLVACEFSGVVRDAFTARGHEAWSCDLLDCERGPESGLHHTGDVLDVIRHGFGAPWDLMIAHPPCTYLCGMGIWWNHKRPERIPHTEAAIQFVRQLMAAPIDRIAIENPIGCLSTRIRKPDQIVNPWWFGQEFNKPTCLWLKNLPPLIATDVVGKGEFYTKANGSRMSAWSHITSGTRKAERAKIASRTFHGIADAMAEQWSVT